VGQFGQLVASGKIGKGPFGVYGLLMCQIVAKTVLYTTLVVVVILCQRTRKPQSCESTNSTNKEKMLVG
jgi:hypothetical protein